MQNKLYRHILLVSLLAGISCSKGMKTQQTTEEIELKSTAAFQESELIRLNLAETNSNSLVDQLDEQEEEDTTSEGWYLKRSWGMDESTPDVEIKETDGSQITGTENESSDPDSSAADSQSTERSNATADSIVDLSVDSSVGSEIDSSTETQTAESNSRNSKSHAANLDSSAAVLTTIADESATLSEESSFGVKVISKSVLDVESEENTTPTAATPAVDTQNTNTNSGTNSGTKATTNAGATGSPASTVKTTSTDPVTFGVKIKNRFNSFVQNALHSSWTESRRGFCSRFVRQVIEKFVPAIVSRRASLFGGSAIQTARLWRKANLVMSVAETKKTGGFKVGDVVFREYGSGGYGHVGIVFHNGKQLVIAENTTSSRSRDGRLESSFTSFGAITGVGRFIEKYAAQPN